jgi:hypothetical protein
MLRKFVFAILAFGVVTVGLLADEITGKVKSVDADKMKIVITTKDAGDKEFTVDKDTKFVKAGKKGADPTDLPDGLKNKAFTADMPARVTITFEKKGDKEVVSEVKIAGGRGGKKKDK